MSSVIFSFGQSAYQSVDQPAAYSATRLVNLLFILSHYSQTLCSEHWLWVCVCESMCVCVVMWPDDTFLSLLVSCCVCAGTWQNLPSTPLHPASPLPLYTTTATTRHPSSSQSASHTAPSLRHLHISSSLGQSIKLNPCLGWLTNGWWAHIVMELFI